MAAAIFNRGDVIRVRDERWTVTESAVYSGTTIVTVVGCDRTNRGAQARYLLPFEPVERLTSVETTRIVSMRRWARLAGEALAQATPSFASLRAAAGADITILPYQLEPALAVVSGAATRILLADAVGLGKTIQAGLIVAEILARSSDAHVLILCPATLRDQWRSELASRFHLTPVVLDSATLGQAAPDGVNPWAGCPLVLTSIDYAKRPEVVKALEPLVWDLIIVDEAHGIARLSDRHVAATLLAQRARTVVLLSATPHSGDDASFDRLASAGDIDGRFPLLVFRRTHDTVAGSSGRRTRWMRVRPTSAERHLHRALMAYVRRVWRRPATPAAVLAMIVLTRRACSSALSLSRTLERRLALLSADHRDGQLQLPLNPLDQDDEDTGIEMGSPGLQDAQGERDALETLISLARRAAGAESKLRWLARLLRRARESAIVFTEYRDTLATLEGELGRFGTCQLHGGLTAAERAHVIREFTTGEQRVLLATDAASEGLNLHQRCRLVVHLEVPWTPTRIEQRVGRVDRIGQSRTVHQVLLVAADTVEESRVSEVARRTLRAAAVLDDLSATPVDERSIAAHIIDSEPLRQVTGQRAHLAGALVAADLRTQATTEAARLRIVRELTRTTGPPSSRLRPFVAWSCRRVAGSGLWAVWVEVTDSDGQLVWETIAGATGHWRAPRPASRQEARALVDRSWSRVTECVTSDQDLRDILSLDSIRTVAALALKREAALADSIEQQRARMASRLVQGGLFDRRAERSAQSQRELLEQALSRCGERRAALERVARPTLTVRPAFALIPW